MPRGEQIGYDVELLRQEEFPLTETTAYMNHAAIAPMPVRTIAAVQECVNGIGYNPTTYFMEKALPLFGDFLKSAATFVNAPSPKDLCYVVSTSAGLGLVALAIDWQPGDEIVFCDVEFPANVYPWMALEKRGVKCQLVPAEKGTLTVEALDRVVNKRTRLVAVSAIQFFTGAKADLYDLGAYCRDRNILFSVDAIQAIGHMPIDVQAMNIDILATGGQKSLLAMTGIGFLYVRPEVCEKMIPASLGANAVMNWEHWLAYDLTPLEGAGRFNTGTPNVAGMVSVINSIGLLNELDRSQVDAQMVDLGGYVIDELESRGYRVVTQRGVHGPIVTFQYSKSDDETTQFVAKATQQKVLLGKHLDAVGEPYVRISLHCYNTKSDLQRFLNLL